MFKQLPIYKSLSPLYQKFLLISDLEVLLFLILLENIIVRYAYITFLCVKVTFLAHLVLISLGCVISSFILITSRLLQHLLIIIVEIIWFDYIAFISVGTTDIGYFFIFMICHDTILVIFFINLSMLIYYERVQTNFSLNKMMLKTEKSDIIEFYKKYKLQIFLAHAQMLHFVYLIYVWCYYFDRIFQGTLILPEFECFFVSLPWYWFLPPIIALNMVNGVRLESSFKLYIAYITSLFMVILNMLIICGVFLSDIVGVRIMAAFLILLSIISMVNTFLCQRNFGKNLKIYLNYRPWLDIYDYNDDLDTIFPSNENESNKNEKKDKINNDKPKTDESESVV
ncbi:hypothetical protein F8M41_001485 [Gigaspora margarita]|uniref:Uncharacterized protein n=1 Tax=Gigaspora margarita TaxID=4874 RepID=A0A8H3XF25_GIGMA|nr:hypothetical protein F8M41_001485 [Gigaspora margarita]